MQKPISYAVLILLILAVHSFAANTSANGDRSPNVLLISIDDLNDWIEPMGGHPQAITPNLSEFAEEAVVFQNAYCASPSCNPSRTALLTACTKNVSLVDIFPTLTELCGLPPKEGASGNSLMPLLRNPADTTWDYPVVTMLGNNHFSIRKDEWHYIIYDGSEAELYNLKDDPEEWSNLIGMPGYLDIIKELHQYIPTERKELVKTKPIRWADVLSGETKFYE